MERGGVSRWLMPSIGEVLFVCIFLWTLSMGAKLLNDGDTGWHIVTGNIIIKTMQVPSSDPFSYTNPGIPWTAHEWLAEVIMSAAHSLGGLNAVVAGTAFIIALTFYLLYRYLVYMGIRPLASALITVLATSVSTLHWLARPHVLSFPLTLAFIAALDSYQRGKTDRLIFLPLLMVFWVNVHGGYILGIMLLCLYIGGNLLMALFQEDERAGYLRKAKRIGIITAVTLAAACLNPHGPEIFYFPFHLVGRGYIMDNVQEWLSPDFHVNKPFELMMFIFITAFVMSKKRPDVFEGGAALMLLHMSLYSARYIPLMALIVTPAVAGRIVEVLDRLFDWGGGVKAIKTVGERVRRIAANTARMEVRFSGPFWVAAVSMVCLYMALSGGFDYRYNPERFPIRAMDFAIKHHINGNMFNNDGWGGYIIYRAYPEYRVFFDGRSDMYGVEFMKEYIKVARAKLGFREVLDKYGVDWVIYNANAPLCRLLAESGDWKLVYADETANILLKDIPENRQLIEKYKGAHFVPKDTDD